MQEISEQSILLDGHLVFLQDAAAKLLYPCQNQCKHTSPTRMFTNRLLMESTWLCVNSKTSTYESSRMHGLDPHFLCISIRSRPG